MNQTDTQPVENQARLVELDGRHSTWGWIQLPGITIEQAAIQYATEAIEDNNASIVVIEVQRDGVSHLITVTKVVSYHASGLRGNSDTQ